MGKRGNLFSKAFVISLCIVLLNVGFIVFRNFQSGTITGNSINDIANLQVSATSKIFFLAQIVLLSVVMVFVFIYDRRKDVEAVAESDLKVIKPHSNETDLDILYSNLQKRKKISLGEISKSFSVKKDVAMEWCKILETGELATIDYPGFGEPKLVLIESQKEEIIPTEVPEKTEAKEMKKLPLPPVPIEEKPKVIRKVKNVIKSKLKKKK